MLLGQRFQCASFAETDRNGDGRILEVTSVTAEAHGTYLLKSSGNRPEDIDMITHALFRPDSGSAILRCYSIVVFNPCTTSTTDLRS